MQTMQNTVAVWKHSLLGLCLGALLVACAGSTRQFESGAAPTVDYGVLIMAHGGSAEWNAAVQQAAASMSNEFPVQVAFGMADAGSLERAVRNLEQAGVRHVGVVRLFISGESWYERTQQILGNQTGAPDKATAMREHAGHTMPGMPMGFWRIDTDLEFYLSDEGLADAEEMDQVVLSRIRALSRDPDREVAVVLAHGPGDDGENQRWIAKISERTRLAAQQLGLSDIRVFTLREDWQDKREAAEREIRDYVQQAKREDKTVLVVPYRVMGFGPYHEVLAGLDYRADETGLVPHANVNAWLLDQARALRVEAQRHQRELLAAGSH